MNAKWPFSSNAPHVVAGASESLSQEGAGKDSERLPTHRNDVGTEQQSLYALLYKVLFGNELLQ